MSLKKNDYTRDIPVIVCSVLKEPQLALALGAEAYVTKPVTQQALLRARSVEPRGFHPGSRTLSIASSVRTISPS
ncbi:MAG: hypothetical protein ACP5SI_04200 [Chloroflexia bacterium]